MLNWNWQRLALVTIAFVVVGGGLLWIVWELEERKKPVRTRVVGEDEGGAFVVEMKDQEEYDLIIHCDEERFQEAFEKFAAHAQIESDYPPLRVPGGPMVLAMADLELPEGLQPAKRAAIAYLDRHAPHRIVLVAHSECLLYDTIAAWHDELSEVKQRQLSHLQMAREAIKHWFPNAEVELYYAELEGDHLTFCNVADELSVLSIDGAAIEDDAAIEE